VNGVGVRADRGDVGAEIVLCEQGPLLVRGSFVLVTTEGETVDAHRRTVALCRCGNSARRPFCDGAHKRLRPGRGHEEDRA